MIDILSITGVIFLLIGVGYGAVRTAFFSPAEMGTLGKFVVNLALPALVFRAVSSHPPSEIANPGYMGAVLLGSLSVFALGYVWSRRVTGETAQASTFRAMGMSCANSGFVGYPVLLMALPDVASSALAMNMVIENLVMLPLALALAEHAQGATAEGQPVFRQIAFRLMRSPILIGMLLGLLVAASGIALPMVISRPIDIMASASAALSLAVIGGTLATLPLRSVKASMFTVVAGKLLAHPLAVALGLGLMAVLGFRVSDPQLAAAAIIMAAMPVMGIYPILAQRYGEERNAALAMFVMTLLSFVTISATLALVLP